MNNEQFLKTMGAKIKARRKELKMGLPTLSALCKTDISNLWFIENGERNTHILTLKSIADVLGVNIKEFL